MNTTAFTAFYETAKAQVTTVVTKTRTAAVVIFAAGLLTGCVFF